MSKRAIAKMAPRPLFPMVAEGAVRAWLAPKLAADAVIDLKPALSALDARKFDVAAQVKFRDAINVALRPGKNGKAKLAHDADVADIQDVLSQLEDMAPEIADLVVGGPADMGDPNAPMTPPGAPTDGPPGAPPGPGAKADPTDPDPAEPDPTDPDDAADPADQAMTFLSDKLSPEDLETFKAMMKGPTGADAAPTKAAMDAAIAASTKVITKRVRDEMRAVQVAEKAVLPFVGAITTAMDSAADVYSFALKKMGVDLTGIDPSAFPAILGAHAVNRRPSISGNIAPRVAADSDITSYTERYGDARKRLK